MIQFDTKSFDAAMNGIKFNATQLLRIEQAGSNVLQDGMRQRAAVDSGEMRDKIKSHVTKSDITTVEDEIGSDAAHAIYQEYGTGIFAENGQGRKTPWVYRRKDGKFITTSGNSPHPFVRPTVKEDHDKTINAMQNQFNDQLRTQWK
jgi:HK97 gp10 family phage protein